MSVAIEPRGLNPSYAQKREPALGAMRSTVQNEQTDDGQTEAERAEQARRDILSATINERIRLAIEARQGSGIEEIWQQSLDLYEGRDERTGNALVKTRDQVPRKGSAGDGRSKVLLNITKPKTDIGVARVAEMLVPTDDRPWKIDATPIPELDDAMQDPNRLVKTADGQDVHASLIAAKLKDEARLASEAMSTWIEDHFVEGAVYAEMRKQIRDAGRIGTGVLKGPFPVSRKEKKWIVDSKTGQLGLKLTKDTKPTSKCVRAQDCFPDPACGENIHDGADFVERDYLTGKKLRELAELEDYDAFAIAMALAEGPQTFSKSRSQNYAERRTEGNTDFDQALYEIYHYYGDVQPEDMIRLGMGYDPQDPEGEHGGLTDVEMQLYTVPAVVTLLNGRPIKCIVNPMETGAFPYDFFTWDVIDGQPWGRGIPYKMAVAQRILTAVVRALLENAGLSSGPIIAMAREALTPADGRDAITGRKLYYFEPNEYVSDINKALAVFDIPSVQKDLMAIIEFALRMADVLTNMPMLMQGDQQAGTSPETLGGMKLLVQNALAPLRAIAKQHDDQVTSRHLNRWNDWGLEKGPDEIKGDHNVQARGSTALIQREEGREFLMLLFPMLDNPAFQIDPVRYATELAKSSGYNMKLVQYTEDEWKAKQAEMAKNPPPPDPAVQAAQIRTQGLVDVAKARSGDLAATSQMKASENEKNRMSAAALAEIDRQIEIMRLSGESEQSIMSIKAALATAAMKNRLSRDEMQLSLETGQGI